MVRAIIVIGILHITTGAMIRFTADFMAIMVGAIRAFIQDIMAWVGVSAGAGVDMDMDGAGMDMAGVEDMDVAGVVEATMATAVDTTQHGMATIMALITNL